MDIFVLEDDENIGIGLRYSLENEGYNVTIAKTVTEGEKIINSNKFSLYILDLTLPDGNGYDVCKLIKSKGNYPVIFLTAYDDEINVVTGFDLGADDYISKPFRVRELIARIKSVLRRYNSSPDGIININGVLINTNKATINKNGEEIILTAMEYRLLLTLINNRGKILTRNNLLEEIWDVEGDFVNDNTLTVYIKRLRDKIEDEPTKPKIIKTVRGLGYQIENEK
jgi:DNA-binding response OmpR family regulator